jgi:7-carboxy-7-deazaguanine synthase
MPEPQTYTVNEIFYSLQGEGARAGTANVFVRFSGCNLTCKRETEGFDCDTEFVSGRKLTASELVTAINKALLPFQPHLAEWVILTGGEPSLQIDDELIAKLKEHGFKLAIETNGLCDLPDGLDWITVSPKTAEHTIRVKLANEVKYVRAVGQAIPRPSCKAEFQYISPAFDSHGFGKNNENLLHCIELVKQNPEWRLSIQQHKIWSVR